LLNDVAKNNGGFLGLLLRSYAGHRVPAKHFLLMTFLFDTPEEFEAAYEQARAVFESDGEFGLQRQLTDLRERLTHMVENEGSSINHAAEVLGIPPGMAVRTIRMQDIPYQRRPRVLNAEREAKLVALLKAGEPREAIAVALSIRRSFIKDYLATHEELLSQWQTAYDNRNREAHRTRFLLTLSHNPDLPIKRIRRLPTNGFQWLYNNDREWLLQQLPSLWSR
jgi:transposase